MAQTHTSDQTRTDKAINALNTLPGSQLVAQITAPIKPKLRGWIHLFTAPLAMINSFVLIALGPTLSARLAAVAYGLCAVTLFGVSATYHIGDWSPRVKGVLRRMDHANIFLLIAGTYTPLSVVLLDGVSEYLILGIVWGGSILGILMHIFWINAPRWVYVPLYIALGWVALWFLPDFWRIGGPAIVWLLLAGGFAYTIGAVMYGFKRPNPWPRYFGFHEFFHTGTVIGYICHTVAVWLAMFVG
ncbi:MAG: hemolysin III family protein [Actinomycetaceae bacterium]|nr:hemolysin III family protein [Arcanobacterium sp.]MDD7505849.1 hemolysin III family protein [Actinomycetaceae bacterium]MDY6143767.1 hemolysin III family protein [Arcanobacterium sp.]